MQAVQALPAVRGCWCHADAVFREQAGQPLRHGNLHREPHQRPMWQGGPAV